MEPVPPATAIIALPPVPDGPYGEAILRGKALLANTRDSLPITWEMSFGA
jgi:hypothetical protein